MKNALRIGFGILFVVSLYLLPTGIAMLRRTKNIGSVAVIDTLLGWTIIGYVVSLAMAFRSKDATPLAA